MKKLYIRINAMAIIICWPIEMVFSFSGLEGSSSVTLGGYISKAMETQSSV